jgi:hypothetical protein
MGTVLGPKRSGAFVSMTRTRFKLNTNAVLENSRYDHDQFSAVHDLVPSCPTIRSSRGTAT